MTKARFSEGDWRKPARAPRSEITPAAEAFLEWLVDPDRTGSQAEYARTNGHDPSTLTKWKKDELFIRAWEKRLAAMNVSPERTQSLMDIAHDIAQNGDAKDADRLKAVELYMRLVDKISPNRVVIEDSRSASDLSDEELASELEAQVIALRASDG